MTTVGKRVLIGACVALGTLLIFALNYPGLRPQPPDAETVSGVAAIGGPFTLTDQHDQTVTDDVLKGHYSLVYFGFINCPDICPLTLQTMTLALEIAGPPAETILPVFITVDPERDTVEAMGAFVANFHPRFVALTGTVDQVRTAAQEYRVFYAKQAAKNEQGQIIDDYSMAHSGYVFLIGPDGHYVDHFEPSVSAQDIAARLRRELAQK